MSDLLCLHILNLLGSNLFLIRHYARRWRWCLTFTQFIAIGIKFMDVYLHGDICLNNKSDSRVMIANLRFQLMLYHVSV